MTAEVMGWTLVNVRIPTTIDQRQRPHLKLVLLCLANEADLNGCDSFPAISAICVYTELSRSTVIRTLAKLEELCLIQRGSQEVVRAYVDRADRIPMAYSLTPNGVSYGIQRGVIRDPTGCHKEVNGVSYETSASPVAEEAPLALHARTGAVSKDRATNRFKKEEGEDGTGTQKHSLVEGGVGGDPEPAAKPKRTPARGRKYIYSPEFEVAWEQYGRHGEKHSAMDEWKLALARLQDDEKTFDEAVEMLFAGVLAYVQSTPRVKYRKHFQRWLKNDMWESAVISSQPVVERADDRRYQGSKSRHDTFVAGLTHEEKIKYGVIHE